MTKREIATVCHTIEELQERGTKYSTMKTLFTKEAFALFEEPVFECRHCGKKVCYDELVNADEMEVDEIVDGYATCEECVETGNIWGFQDGHIDCFDDLFGDALNCLRGMYECIR